MDPSHACFLHDGIAGKWEEAAPLTMHLKHNQIDTNQVSALFDISRNLLYVRVFLSPGKHPAKIYMNGKTCDLALHAWPSYHAPACCLLLICWDKVMLKIKSRHSQKFVGSFYGRLW